MNPTSGPLVVAATVGLALCTMLVAADDRPVSGREVPGFEPVDDAILGFMDRIGCHAATLAISRDHQLLYSRGYGWSDEARERPVRPDALLRIASVTKPVTAAAVKNAIRAGLLSADTRAFDLIALKPPGGTIADPRIGDITVGHLLAHRGGWDREATFDPMFRATQIEQEFALPGPARPENVIEYMLTQPLQFAPGDKVVYSNFGYCVLGRVLEKATQKPYPDCIQQDICRPLGIEDIKLGSRASKRRDPREVWYPVDEDAFPLDVMDAHGGLIASAPALCRFLEAYWISGEPRQAGQRADYTSFGSLPGTTAMARQRADGMNVAVLMNGRREHHAKDDNESLKTAVDRAISAIRSGE